MYVDTTVDINLQNLCECSPISGATGMLLYRFGSAEQWQHGKLLTFGTTSLVQFERLLISQLGNTTKMKQAAVLTRCFNLQPASKFVCGAAIVSLADTAFKRLISSINPDTIHVCTCIRD